MKSPFFLGGAANFGPPPGLAGLLAERDRELQDASQSIGNLAGALGSGAVGAVQGAMNPSAFGEGTGTGTGATKAFFLNFNNARDGGGGGGGFSRLVNNGGGGPSGSMNFKQFAAMGKAADAVRDSVKAATPSMPDQQPSVMGYTDDEWKHIGTNQKIAALQGFQQSLNAKQMMQAYQLGQQHLAQAQQDAAAQSNFQAWAKAEPLRRGVQAMAGGAGPVNPPALSPMDYFAGAVNAGVDPVTASQMGENLSRMAALGAKQDLGNTVPKRVELGGTPVIYSERTGTFQIDPAYAINQRAQNAKDLLNQRLAGLSAADQLKSLDTQQKAVEGDLMLTNDEKQAKLAAIDAARQELVNKKQGAAPPAAPAAGRFKIVGVK